MWPFSRSTIGRCVGNSTEVRVYATQGHDTSRKTHTSLCAQSPSLNMRFATISTGTRTYQVPPRTQSNHESYRRTVTHAPWPPRRASNSCQDSRGPPGHTGPLLAAQPLSPFPPSHIHPRIAAAGVSKVNGGSRCCPFFVTRTSSPRTARSGRRHMHAVPPIRWPS